MRSTGDALDGRREARRRDDGIETESFAAKRTQSAKLNDSVKPSGRAKARSR
jgi:hypothetical protein